MIKLYSQFLKDDAMRERINDISNPKYRNISDIVLPRNSLFHFLPSLPGEVGPSNTSNFISNYPKRINMYFWEEYEIVLEKSGIKRKPFQFSKAANDYFKTHFNYQRARNFSFLTKEQELFVNNIAPSFIPIVYYRKTVYTTFHKHYNELTTVINSINSYSEMTDRNQFIEFKLPKVFPSYLELKMAFDKYKLFFNENYEIVKYNKEALKRFHANKSYWLLDLYGFLMGFDLGPYSLFSKLTDKSLEKLSIIFTHEGRCWIANLKTLRNLIAYSDKEDDTKIPQVKINYFKRFYINLISVVTEIDLSVIKDLKEDSNNGITVEDNENTVIEVDVNGEGSGEEKGKAIPSGGEYKADSHTSDMLESTGDINKGSGVSISGTSTNEGEEGDSTLLQEEENNKYGIQDSVDENNTVEWGEDIPDEVFEQVIVEEQAITNKKVKYTPTTVIEKILDDRAKSGRLTTKEKEYFLNIANSYKDIMIGDKTLEETIDIKPEEMILKPSIVNMNQDLLLDKSVIRSRSRDLTLGYNSQLLERNIVEMATYVQNGGFCLLDLNKEEVITADSKYDVYTMKVQSVSGGSSSTRRFRIPKVEEDGTFTIDGTKSYAQITRMEKPVRKIRPEKVQLTSYYDKPRIIIERSTMNVDNYELWIFNRILESTKRGVSITRGKFKANYKNACYYYDLLAAKFSTISYKGLTFNFDTQKLIGNDKEALKLCNTDTWVIGKKNDNWILIDSNGLLSIDGKSDYGYIEEFLELPLVKAPVPMSTININGYNFPLVVVLSYWMGFDNLLKTLNADYRLIEPNTRPVLEPFEYMITFADERMVFNSKDRNTSLIISGLRKLSSLNNFSREHLNDPNVWFSLMDDARVKPNHFKEMTQIYNMFIDPITRRLLVKDKYPTQMDLLCIEANKLLLTNYSPTETEITEQRFVGYERFAGHVYRELCKATRQFNNKPNTNKKTFDLNPEAVMLNILTDPSIQRVEEANPVQQAKQQEEVTYGGTMGRSEQAMVRRTRGMQKDYIGIISEAGKDSGKIGFVSYLTSDAKFVDYYGNVDVDQKPTKSGLGSISLNLLYGGTKDDNKRAMFSSVQQSQVTGCNSYTSNPLRTSYDTILAHRTSELYSSIAKKNGKVIQVEPEGIVVEYEDKSTDKFSLGLEITKAAGEYHKHNKVTDLTVGDKFVAGQILAWDEIFFERDNIDKTRVVWKSGTMARVALIEDQTTFEDSIALSKPMADKLESPFVLPKEARVYDNERIKIYVKIGDTVDFNQVLCDIEDRSVASLDMYDDAEKFTGLEREGIKQIKSPQAGVVSKIEVIYNGEIDDFSPETIKVIKQFDSIRSKAASFKKNTAATGNVGGNTAINKSKVYPGSIQVTFYIENQLASTTADKFVLGNQMKGTCGYIYPQNLTTEDGRPVHITFSLKSLLNRMVLSMRDKLVINEVNNVFTNRLIEKYEGKSKWEI